jgi:hypothetical protein
MIRVTKGNTQSLTTKAISAAIEGYSKTSDEFRTKTLNEHVPTIRNWTRAFAEVRDESLRHSNVFFSCGLKYIFTFVLVNQTAIR